MFMIDVLEQNLQKGFIKNAEETLNDAIDSIGEVQIALKDVESLQYCQKECQFVIDTLKNYILEQKKNDKYSLLKECMSQLLREMGLQYTVDELVVVDCMSFPIPENMCPLPTAFTIRFKVIDDNNVWTLFFRTKEYAIEKSDINVSDIGVKIGDVSLDRPFKNHVLKINLSPNGEYEEMRFSYTNKTLLLVKKISSEQNKEIRS